jgi:DNA polymerase-1
LRRVKDQRPTWARAAALARGWELNQLADRLEELALRQGAAQSHSRRR